ncbi:PP2C family protein-serine/threonine phosphatase [Gryllotalpicola ginsengisoli]|uniref:PP2C family protein-serine/threonine phosphatase n=1 Tax=Gryllotalpicola ginsengisoli TaxID=444608 RepID=UPI0003B39ECB|nr:protein phosphatase 2C domain-containing protein [Gryllotalpicola ginsengisoli]
MPYTVDVSAHSDTGRVRTLNEDSFLAADPMFFVADGMGGHAFGDRASQAAVAELAAHVPPGSEASPDDVLAAVRAANSAVRALSGVDDTGPAVAGTTLTGVARVTTGGAEFWMVVNIGDSRVYSWDGRKLAQLTVDHSAVQELVDAGEITADEALAHPERNVITRALGADEDADVDVWLLPVRSVRSFLICSDGLTKELPEERIGAILAGDATGEHHEGHPPRHTAELLVEAAVEAGGHDNVTAIVVEWQPEGAEGADETRERDELPGMLEETWPRG